MWDQLLQNIKNQVFKINETGQPSALGRLVGAQPVHQVPKAQPVKLAPPPPQPKPQVNLSQLKIGTPTPLPGDVAARMILNKQPGLQRVDRPTPTPTAVPMRRPTPTPTPTPVTYPDATSYENQTMGTFRKYDVPLPVAYGIAAAEGGKRNRFNIGAVDSNPTLAPVWSDLEAATKAAKLLSGEANPGFYAKGAIGKQEFKNAYALRSNPAAMLEAIMNAGYAGNPQTWKDRSVATGGAGLNFNSWADFVKSTPAYKKWLGRK